MKCPNCGVEVPGGAGFCHECGTELSGAAAPASTATEPANAGSTDTPRQTAAPATASSTQNPDACPGRFAALADTPVFGEPEKSTAVGVIAQGDELPIEGEAGDLWHVRMPDGERGYVSKAAGSRIIGAPRPASVATPSQRLLARPATPTDVRTASTPAERGAQPAHLLYVACNALLLISTFLSWETNVLTSRVAGDFGDVGNASGLQLATGRGVLLAALWAGGASVWSMFEGRTAPGLRGIQFIAAGFAIGMALIQMKAVAGSCQGDAVVCAEASLGIGAVLALIFGAALAALATFVPPNDPAQQPSGGGER